MEKRTITKEGYIRLHRMADDDMSNKMDDVFGSIDGLEDNIEVSEDQMKSVFEFGWESKAKKRLLNRVFGEHQKMSKRVIDMISVSNNEIHITAWWAKEDPQKPHMKINRPLYFWGGNGDNNIYQDDYSFGNTSSDYDTMIEKLTRMLDSGEITFKNPIEISL